MNKLFYLSGQDIPFFGAQTTITNPRIKDISLLKDEKTFYTGCEIITVDVKDLKIEEPNVTNYDIFMEILEDKKNEVRRERLSAQSVISLLFPDNYIFIKDRKLSFADENRKVQFTINQNNFPEFQKIVSEMFKLGKTKDESEYNPQGSLAEKIAEKLKERQKKLNKDKTDGVVTFDIIERYVSILSVGLHLSINEVMNYSYYQLFDSVERMQAKFAWDMSIKAKMAGATGGEDPVNWMDDLHNK